MPDGCFAPVNNWSFCSVVVLVDGHVPIYALVVFEGYDISACCREFCIFKVRLSFWQLLHHAGRS